MRSRTTSRTKTCTSNSFLTLLAVETHQNTVFCTNPLLCGVLLRKMEDPDNIQAAPRKKRKRGRTKVTSVRVCSEISTGSLVHTRLPRFLATKTAGVVHRNWLNTVQLETGSVYCPSRKLRPPRDPVYSSESTGVRRPQSGGLQERLSAENSSFFIQFVSAVFRRIVLLR